MENFVVIVVILSAIWVFFDARKIGVRKGLIKGLMNMGPWGWALCCLWLWIIVFPLYLIKRGEMMKAAAMAGGTPDRR